MFITTKLEQNKAQRLPQAVLWHSRLVYKISLEFHLWNNSSMAEECAQQVFYEPKKNTKLSIMGSQRCQKCLKMHIFVRKGT